MNINIELNEKYIASLLNIYGYTSERVLVWYNKFDDHNRIEDLGNYWKTIVYPKDNRPKVLEKEKIMFDDVKDMGLTEVINTLFNKLLLSKLFNH